MPGSTVRCPRRVSGRFPRPFPHHDQDVVVAPSHKGRGRYYGAYLISVPVVTCRGCGARGARSPTALLVRGGPAADRADPRRASELLAPSRRIFPFLSFPHPGCVLPDPRGGGDELGVGTFVASSPVLPYRHDPFRMTGGEDGAAASSRTTRVVSPFGGWFSWTRRTIDRRGRRRSTTGGYALSIRRGRSLRAAGALGHRPHPGLGGRQPLVDPAVAALIAFDAGDVQADPGGGRGAPGEQPGAGGDHHQRLGHTRRTGSRIACAGIRPDQDHRDQTAGVLSTVFGHDAKFAHSSPPGL